MADSASPLQLRLLRQWRRGILVVGLALMVAIAALPNYFSGTWPWSEPLEVPRINQLQQLQQEPLPLTGWNLRGHESTTIGRVQWHLAEYEPQQPTDPEVPALVLLIRPQVWHLNQPQVEWVDIRGSQGWRVEQRQMLRFTAPGPAGASPAPPEATVTAQYFRGISDQRTFAILQWYSWPQGGHPAPGRWFWLDQLRQWRHRQRQPWVAVSIILPIEPVGDIRRYEAVAKEAGIQVQSALMAGPFAGM